MGRPETAGGAGFHELPLVLFTSLAIAGAGVGSGQLVLGLLGWIPWIPSRRVAALMAVLLGFGLLLSVGHLGRPFRGPFALARVGKSRLSNEVLVVGVALGASLFSAALGDGHPLAGWLGVAAMAGSVLTLLAVGVLYRLPAQLTWSGPTVLQPLVLGVGLGLSILHGSLSEGAQARGDLLIFLVLFLDGSLLWERMGQITSALARGTPVRPKLMGRRGPALVLRVTLGVLLPAAALLGARPDLAAASLSLNLVLDRFLFYGLAVRAGTDAEVSRVDAFLLAFADDPVLKGNPTSTVAPTKGR